MFNIYVRVNSETKFGVKPEMKCKSRDGIIGRGQESLNSNRMLFAIYQSGEIDINTFWRRKRTSEPLISCHEK